MDEQQNMIDPLAGKEPEHAAASPGSEERFEALLDAIPDVLIEFSVEGRVVRANGAAIRFLGPDALELSREQVERRLNLRHADGSPIAPHDLPISRALQGETANSGQFLVTNAEGKELVGSVFAAPLRKDGAAPSGVIVLWHDITELKGAEDALRRHAAELTAANRSLEAFAYSVSHDLRNPLHSILACCEVVKDSLHRNDADAMKALQHISDATQRMSQVITDLMTLSRVTMQEVKITEFNLSDMANSIVKELAILDPSRRVDYVIEPGLAAKADENLVWMLIENLLHNAWKFSSKRATARIEFGRLAEGKTAVFFIRDNGAGFDPAFTERLFKPFQRLHSRQEFAGTGIGLTIVKRIVEKHGGSIWAEAEKDKGATFYFDLGG